VPSRVGVAVVGVGFVGGPAHVPSFKKIEGSELVTLCARTERRVKPLSEKYSVEYCLDYDRLLKDQRIQAVVIALPTPLHFDAVMKAIGKRKHVLCEMPMAATTEQVRVMQKAAEEAGVILMPVLNFRFAPIYLKAREMIESRAIGKPIAFHFREFLPAASLADQWPTGSWAWDIKAAGGYPDFTLSVWSIDMIRWMFGAEIRKVEWASHYAKLEKYGGVLGYNTMGLVKLSNGILGSLHYSATVNSLASTSRLEVYGDNTNVLHAIWNDRITLYGAEQKPEEWNLDVKGTKVWGHRQLDEHFIDCILHGRQPQVTAEDAIKAQEVAQQITKTAKQNGIGAA